MANHMTAARAQLFMRQCRSRTTGPTTSTKRSVSSSHLAPSNFSKPLRLRDELSSDSTSNNRFTDVSIASQLANIATPSLTTKSSHGQPSTRPPPITVAPAIPPGFWNFIKHRILNIPPPRPKHKPPPFNAINNPYKARKRWPPDFRNLHPKQQFHFEKTFRRRAIIKAHSQRYNWNRYIRLLQQSLIVMTVVYFLFIADPYHKEGGGTPVDGFRAWFFGQFAKNQHIPEDLRRHSEELREYYSKNAHRNTQEIEEVTQKAREANLASSEAVLEARAKFRGNAA